MEMTELDNAFREIKADNIKSIDSEIDSLELQIRRLRAKRDSLMVGDLDLVGKYFRVSNFGMNYVHYIHAEDMSPNKEGVDVIGETYVVLDTRLQGSVEYLKEGKLQYDLDPDFHSNIFEEISEEEYKSEISKVLDTLSNTINK